MKWTLKAIRTNLNLTQDEMARELEVCKKTYQEYEEYKKFPSIKMVKRIIEMSNLNFDDIIFLPEDYAISVKSETK